VKTFVIGDLHGRRTQLLRLLEAIPRDPARDTVVLLGDLIDRGREIPESVEEVTALWRENPERVVCLRGNHEQMLLDFVDAGQTLWLHAAVGSECTIEQYTGERPRIRSERDFAALKRSFAAALPQHHLEFFRQMPLFHEDDYALYVHAGLNAGRHPRETEAYHLLWSRDGEFFRNYTGKPCVFGHTPTPLLPLRGRLGHHGIYMCNSAVGIDTGYVDASPLSCLQLPDLLLYQAYADGRTATHRITTFVPEPLRAMQRRTGGHPQPSPAGT
jgi:serine/threonine protein phosphatase 1